MVANLKAFDDQFPDVLAAGHREATQDVSEALGNYPAVPQGSSYIRTMAYADTQVIEYVSPTESYVATPVEHAIYLRGDGESYPGAYMHVGWWESITDIVARLTQPIIDIFNNRIEGLIWRIFGS